MSVLFHKEIITKYQIEQNDILYKGSTSLIITDKKNDNYVIGFTNDEARVAWFKDNKSRLKFTLKEEIIIGNKHEGTERVYVYRMKRFKALSADSITYVINEIIGPFTHVHGGDFFRLYTLLRKTSSMSLRDMFIRMKRIICDHNNYYLRLNLSDFLEDDNGKVYCISPLTSKK